MDSLVLMHVGANTGYAIGPLEGAFFRVCRRLGGDASTSVHFAYPDFSNGQPTSIPASAPTLSFNTRSPSRTDLDQIERYVRQHSIKFVLCFDMQPVSPVFRALRRGGVKTILAYWGAPISGLQSPVKLALKRLLLSISRSRLDGMIFESKAMAELAVRGRGVPRDLIDIVPLGIDISKFSSERSAFVYEALGLPPDRKIVVYAGHMEERKGVRHLVNAAIELLQHRKRSDVSFLIFGNRDDQEIEHYRAMYSGMPIEDRIVFGGYRGDLAKCFAGCHIGVIPSSGWDSFPRTSVELAACGLPLVVTRLGGLPECVVDGETGLIVSPGEHIELANAIQKLLDDPDSARKMGENGRRRCEREFSLAIQEERLLKVFRRRIGTSS